MSRVGQKFIEIPDSVSVNVRDDAVSAKGPKGELSVSVPSQLVVMLEDGVIKVTRRNEDRGSKALHGLH